MAGTLGETAFVHIRQLSLFGMITLLPDNIIHKIANEKLASEPDNSTSWFTSIRKLCTKYNLPSPLSLMSHPPTKSVFKNMIKKKVLDFWQQEHREDAKSKPSLSKFFKPDYMSLTQPHPLWTTSHNNSFEINKSLVVSKLLSGRYRSDWLCRHWSKSNPSGFCLLCPGKMIPGTVEHMLVACEGLAHKREDITMYWKQQTEDNEHLQALTTTKLCSEVDEQVQFLLDPSVVPSVIRGCQLQHFSLDDVFKLTRTFCYALHRRRLQLIGRFNYRK